MNIWSSYEYILHHDGVPILGFVNSFLTPVAVADIGAGMWLLGLVYTVDIEESLSAQGELLGTGRYGVTVDTKSFGSLP